MHPTKPPRRDGDGVAAPESLARRVSALVCTRNRPDSVIRTVRSLLLCRDPFELLVIDQSSDDRTIDALVGACSDAIQKYCKRDFGLRTYDELL